MQALGYLPSLLGFALPDESSIRAAGLISSDAMLQPDGQRRAWAGWLCGAVLVYGLLPRLLLLVISVWRLRAGTKRLRLALHSAEWSALNERLSPPSQLVGVTDPAPDFLTRVFAGRRATATGTGAALVVAFELGGQITLPAGLPVHTVMSRQQRAQVLELLAQQSPRALLLVCDSTQTPDRGSLAWIDAAAQAVGHVRVLLAGEGEPARRKLWLQQLQSCGIADDSVFSDEAAALRWLHGGTPSDQRGLV